MFLNGDHDRREDVLVEEDYSFDVQFRAEQVKEDVLAVALVQLGALIGQFIEHGEGLRRVRHTGDHLTHRRLQLYHFVLQLLIVCLELVSLLSRRRELRSHDLQLIFGLFKFLKKLTL